MTAFTVDRDVKIKRSLSPWVSEQFLAVPSQTYDALGEEGPMPHRGKYQITFTPSGVHRADETVEADSYEDTANGEFVDFKSELYADERTIVARYRAKDIRRVLLIKD